MDSTVDLSFRYLESDYVRAMRSHYASRLRLKLDIPVVLMVAAFGIYLWHSSTVQWLGVICVISSAVFALILVAAFFVVPYLAFRREPKFLADYSLTFSPDGIHFRTAHIDSQLKWSTYSHALVTSHSYVLYYGAHLFTVIPKRVFQSGEQQECFELLLSQHVSRVVRRKLR